MNCHPGRRLRWAFTWLALVVAGSGAFARDFPERPRSVVLAAPHRHTDALLPRTWADTGMTYQLWQGSPEDEFQLRQMLHMALADWRGLTPSIYYGTFMFAGPVNEGDTPGADAAQWMMNAIQFEYGVTLQYRMAAWTLLAEYGRRSYHPLRGGFAEPAADLVRAGVAPPSFEIGPAAFETLVRLSWIDLYDFWGARIPGPQDIGAFHGAVEARIVPLAPGLEPFAVVMWDLLLREAGGLAREIAVEAGLALSRGRERFELYIDYYRSPDTEQREDRRSPARLVGYGLRFVVDTDGD